MLSAEIQELVDRKISGTDILHGYLKNEILKADQEFAEIATEEEEGGYSDAMLSMDRTRAEGFLEALVMVNSLVIDLTYALEERARG